MPETVVKEEEITEEELMEQDPLEVTGTLVEKMEDELITVKEEFVGEDSVSKSKIEIVYDRVEV